MFPFNPKLFFKVYIFFNVTIIYKTSRFYSTSINSKILTDRFSRNSLFCIFLEFEKTQDRMTAAIWGVRCSIFKWKYDSRIFVIKLRYNDTKNCLSQLFLGANIAHNNKIYCSYTSVKEKLTICGYRHTFDILQNIIKIITENI